MSNHDLTKLPKWAQDEIAQLKRENTALERQIALIQGQNLFAEDKYGDIRVPVHKRFYAGDVPNYARVMVTFYPGHIDLNSGGAPLRINPVATNRVEVRPEL